MRRSIAIRIAILGAAIFLASCDDASRTTNPTSPIRPETGRLNSTTATCLTYTQLVALVNDVFGAGSPNANSALVRSASKWASVRKPAVFAVGPFGLPSPRNCEKGRRRVCRNS